MLQCETCSVRDMLFRGPLVIYGESRPLVVLTTRILLILASDPDDPLQHLYDVDDGE